MGRNERNGLRTWIEIDRKALWHNFDVFKKRISKRTKLMAVVKSNAYGHSLLDFSREMERLGADFLGVDSIVEALALRREGIRIPILVLGYTLPEMIPAAVKENIALTVSSMPMLRYSVTLARRGTFAKPLKIHIKVDTGMHRQGFLLGDLPKITSSLLRIKPARRSIGAGGDKGLRIQTEGLYTHFASAKNPAFPNDTIAQLAEFQKWIEAFREAGHRPLIHAAATAGALLFPQSHYDCVRIGIGLYGLSPAKEVREHLKGRAALRPALVWKSLITEIKELPQGSRMGYDLTETLPKETTLAIVPVGYWHGYPRALSSIGRVLVKGKECKVLGRVSMDMLTVDVGSVRGVKIGDAVIVMGGPEKLSTAFERVSELCDTSCYETITRLNPLIKRIYL